MVKTLMRRKRCDIPQGKCRCLDISQVLLSSRKEAVKSHGHTSGGTIIDLPIESKYVKRLFTVSFCLWVLIRERKLTFEEGYYDKESSGSRDIWFNRLRVSSDPRNVNAQPLPLPLPLRLHTAPPSPSAHSDHLPSEGYSRLFNIS